MIMKRLWLSTIIVLALLLPIVLSACASEPNALTFQDAVAARFNDGIAIAETFSAPANALEYRDARRVEQVMQIDARVGGLHFTGLYLPAGESLTVTLGGGKLSRHSLVLFPQDGANRQETLLTQPTTTVSAPSDRGASVYLRIDRSADLPYSFETTLTGAAQSPYYRLGIESAQSLQNKVGDAVLESGNVRFVVPQSALDAQIDPSGALRWWRSAAQLLDEIAGTGSFADDFGKVDVFAEPSRGTAHYDAQSDCIRVGGDRLDGCFDYDKLCAEGGGDMLRALAAYKIAHSDGFAGAAFSDGSVTAALAAYVDALMTDRASVIGADGAPSGDAAQYLSETIAGDFAKEESLRRFVGNLTYSLGKDAVLQAIKYYRYTPDKTDAECAATLLCGASRAIGYNLQRYGALFGIELTEDQARAIADLPVYVPVQTALTTGGVEDGGFTGVSVLLGNAQVFDFNGAIVAQSGTWRVVSLDGTDGRWEKTADGVYRYTPSADLLRDRFSVTLTDGADTAVLYGNITVDIRSVQCDDYGGVTYRTIDDAVAGYKNLSVTSSRAFAQAQMPERQDNAQEGEGEYTLSVMHGGMQVPESGKYRFYLTSKGLCRVDFGVSKYHFTMLSNVLTVDAFTDELSYEMTLEAGKVYYFNVFVLNTTGNQRATLGIARVGIDERPAPIGADYLVYEGLRQEQMPRYDAPEIPIADYSIQHSVYDAYDMHNWKIAASEPAVQGSAAENILDGSRNTEYRSQSDRESFVFDINLREGHAFEYFTLGVGVETIGARVVLETSSDGKTYGVAAEGVLTDPETVFKLGQSGGTAAFLRLTIAKGEAFACRVTHLFIGKLLSEATIVPNTSTKLEYQGEWRENRSYVSVNGVVTENTEQNCAVSYKFFGTELSIYATKAPKYGQARIFVDNKEVARVDLNHQTTLCGQQIYYSTLEEGLHSVKIMPIDDSLINLDYFAIVPCPATTEKGDASKLWALAVIPALALVGFVAALIADRAEKTKRRDKARVKNDREGAPPS